MALFINHPIPNIQMCIIQTQTDQQTKQDVFAYTPRLYLPTTTKRIHEKPNKLYKFSALIHSCCIQHSQHVFFYTKHLDAFSRPFLSFFAHIHSFYQIYFSNTHSRNIPCQPGNKMYTNGTLHPQKSPYAVCVVCDRTFNNPSLINPNSTSKCITQFLRVLIYNNKSRDESLSVNVCSSWTKFRTKCCLFKQNMFGTDVG